MSIRDEWRWTDDQGVQRIVRTNELRDAIQQGVLSPDVLVWRQGMKQWVAARTLPEFSTAKPDVISDEPSTGDPPGQVANKAGPSVPPPPGKRPPQQTLVGLNGPNPMGPAAGPPAPIVVPGAQRGTATRAVTQPPRFSSHPPPADGAAMPEIPKAPRAPTDGGARQPSVSSEVDGAWDEDEVSTLVKTSQPKPGNRSKPPPPPPAGRSEAPRRSRRPLPIPTGKSQHPPAKTPPPPPPNKGDASRPPPPRKKVAPNKRRPAPGVPARRDTAKFGAVRPRPQPPKKAEATPKPVDTPMLDKAPPPKPASAGQAQEPAKAEPKATPVKASATATPTPQAKPAPTKDKSALEAKAPKEAAAAGLATEDLLSETSDGETDIQTAVRPDKSSSDVSADAAQPPTDATETNDAEPNKAPAPSSAPEASTSERPPPSPSSTPPAGESAAPPPIPSESPPRQTSVPPPRPPGTPSELPSGVTGAFRPLNESVSVPMSSLLATGGVWVLCLVSAFLVGRCTTSDVEGVAQSGIERAVNRVTSGSSSSPAPVASSEPKPCWVTRQAVQWAPLASKSVPFSMRPTEEGKLEFGFAVDGSTAKGLEVDPKTGKATELFSQEESDERQIARVTPLGRSSGGFVVTTRGKEEEEDSLVVPVAADVAPFFVTVTAGSVGAADAMDATPAELFSLPGEGGVTAFHLEPAADQYAAIIRKDNALKLGWIGKDMKAASDLLSVAETGGTVGKPKAAFNGTELAIVFAERADGESPWKIRVGRAKPGQAPTETTIFELPEGGPGGDAFAPDLVGMADGRWLLMWTEGPEPTERAVRAITLAPDFTPVGDPIALSPPAGSFGQAQLGRVNTYTTVVFLALGDRGFELWGAILQCG